MNNPVAPKEGHYALLRNGMVARPVLDDWPENPPYFDAYLEIYWYRDGTAQPATSADLDVRSAPLYDIIATISPADMQAVASGELERLRAALKALHDGLAWDWRGHPVGDLPTLREIARTALEGSR